MITVELSTPAPEDVLPGFSLEAARSAFREFAQGALALFNEAPELEIVDAVDVKQMHPFCACVMKAADNERQVAALLYRSIVTMGGLVAGSFTTEACDALGDQVQASHRLTPEVRQRIHELTDKFRTNSTVNFGLIFD